MAQYQDQRYYGTGAGAGGQVRQGYIGESAGANLTQAGVSNFSQQVASAYQQLQRVRQELLQAQNQIEVQVQAQIRQLQQLQQLVEAAGFEVQQIETLSRTPGLGGGYPLA